MTINYSMGAPAHCTTQWSQIDWYHCRREVRKLQVRIVKAVKESRWHKVKALQWLLTHSFSAKALAVKRVTENEGKRTAGVDRKKWTTLNSKWNGILSLKRRGYQASPLRRIYIPKSHGKDKRRALSIPTMKDRAMQALYLQALEPIAETTADPNSYGFRPKRSTADALEKSFNILSKKTSVRWVLEADIKGCFDNIDHDWLLEHIPTDSRLLAQWLKAGFIESHTLFPMKSGTPQGGIISPILANMALDGLETQLKQTFSASQRKRRRTKLHMVRYADDFIVTGYSREFLEKEVKPQIETFLAERGLKLSINKTRIIHVEEGFDFLGFSIRRYSNKLLTKPSRKSIKSLLDKIRGIIKSHPTAKSLNLIRLLNPVIIGWSNYYRHTVAKVVFKNVDHAIWISLWRWAKRRHPKKRVQWIKDKYFKQVGHRHWVFAACDENAATGLIKLVNASDTKIRRHIRIQQKANPFDPEWDEYFTKRHFHKFRY